jgi:protein O-mannosyl-transferase
MKKTPSFSASTTSFILMVIGLLAVTMLYHAALPGYWLFDDWPNLFGLRHVQNLDSAILFIIGGEAGPLGRPLSLATFALQAEAWDDQPDAMLVANFGIHLLAMLSVFLLAAGLAHIRAPRHAWLIGAFVAILWGLNPFLSTTHLMVIQRMTGLAGLFVFAGLALFVWAHLLNGKYRVRAALIAGLGLCTLLATFSKESGALLPLLALTMLVTWIPRDRWLTGPVNQTLLVLLVVVPSILLLGYLGLGFVETLQAGNYGRGRDFTPAERLLTQPVILLDYLRQLFIPSPLAATPFMDNIPASRSWLEPPITLFAFVSWATLATLAFTVRQRTPWFFFGVAFFLVAHVVESTYLGLELYFAHRNYVPAFGLFFSLVYFALTISPRHSLIASTGLIAYALLFGLSLAQVTGNWNDKEVNAELWLDYNPYSVRGSQFLSMQRISSGDFSGARRALDSAATTHSDHVQLHLQRTANCIGREDEFPELIHSVERVLRTSGKPQSMPAIDLMRSAQDPDPSPLCPPRTHSVLISLTDALLANEVYARNEDLRSQLLLAKAFAYAQIGKYEEAIRDFRESNATRPNLDVAFHAMSLQANLGEYQAAHGFLEELKGLSPDHILKRRVWEQRLAEFKIILEESERIDSEAGENASGHTHAFRTKRGQ